MQRWEFKSEISFEHFLRKCKAHPRGDSLLGVQSDAERFRENSFDGEKRKVPAVKKAAPKKAKKGVSCYSIPGVRPGTPFPKPKPRPKPPGLGNEAE